MAVFPGLNATLTKPMLADARRLASKFTAEARTVVSHLRQQAYPSVVVTSGSLATQSVSVLSDSDTLWIASDIDVLLIPSDPGQITALRNQAARLDSRLSQRVPLRLPSSKCSIRELDTRRIAENSLTPEMALTLQIGLRQLNSAIRPPLPAGLGSLCCETPRQAEMLTTAWGVFRFITSDASTPPARLAALYYLAKGLRPPQAVSAVGTSGGQCCFKKPDLERYVLQRLESRLTTLLEPASEDLRRCLSVLRRGLVCIQESRPIDIHRRQRFFVLAALRTQLARHHPASRLVRECAAWRRLAP